jgi:dipeptidyl aminopeptidase/acylaminoacyl peptidase
MRIASIVLAGLCVTACASAQVPATAPAVQAPLIERAKLFGNPTRTQARLSPDGRWLSWIAPRDGVLNIWVAPADDPAQARALTSERTRPIPQHFWAPDSASILFINDQGGDENFRLYGVDVRSGALRTHTPFDKTRAQIVAISPLVKDRILVGLNNRDPKWHDVHSLDLSTGKLTQVLRNEGYAGFTADQSLNVRVARRTSLDGGAEFFRVNNGRVETKPFAVVGPDDTRTTTTLGFTHDGKTLYWRDSRGRDTTALVAQDMAGDATRVVAVSPKADLGGVLVNPRTGQIDAYSVDYLRDEWTGLDPAVSADLQFLGSRLKGEIDVVSRTYADDAWVVSVDPVSSPQAFYRFDRRSKALTKLFVTRPELENAVLSPMHPVEIRSRDGLVQVSYLTLPPGSDANGDGRPERPVPMVLLPHGGPWARDSYGYDAQHQWLANRGYAVLSPNFRSSTGFGKKFTEAGNLQWGLKMQDDLDDAVDWAVRQGVTTADKVAIMGGSYGGYAVLAGMTFTPDRYRCGVDLFGISNVETTLKSLPPYWESLRGQFYRSMGDPRTPEGMAHLKRTSPLYKAAAIKRPLLIGQGANDPRVNVAESEQIVDAMKAKGIPVTYVVFPDEGHGFARPVNNIAFNAVAENFLAKCLGGRAEPIGDALRPSTAQVRVGAELIPGLKEALPVRTAATN